MLQDFDKTLQEQDFKDLVLDDKLLISLILGGNSAVAADFLLNKCIRIFDYINKTRLSGIGIKTDDLVSDFYIYLQQNNWEKLRQFRFESKLQTWISVVASRYFLKKYAIELKEKSPNNTPISSISTFVDESAKEKIVRSEILEAISLLRDKRSQQVILLGLYGYNSDEIAEQLGLSTTNVYVIRSRAITNLKSLLNG